MPNPLEALAAAREKQEMSRSERTHQMWHTWNNNGRKPEHLEPLLQDFQGLIGYKLKEWKPPTIPKSAFEAELHKHVIQAFETYNPNRGASLNTHVNNRIQKVKRYMAQQQNMGRIPEQQVFRIGAVQRATQALQEEYGRMPTHDEIAAHVTANDPNQRTITGKQVGTIIKALRKDIPASAWESDPTPKQTQREHEILPLLRETLTPQEQAVFDHVYGYNGAPVIGKTGQLAKRLGLSDPQVSRLKSAIAAKYKLYQ